MTLLTPSYLNSDFSTMKSKVIEILQSDDVFKDYNYEGSNISLIIELISYLAELNLYYNNKIAENIFPDTTALYENANRLSQWLGYNPRGYLASQTQLDITINQDYVNQYWDVDDELYIPIWKTFIGEFEDEEYNFLTVNNTTVSSAPSATTLTIETDIKQGVKRSYTYHGFDLVDDKIILPFFQFDHNDVDSSKDSIWLSVDGNNWTRVYDFFKEYSGLQDDSKIYKFLFDKYKRYIIEFSDDHKIPENTQEISIDLIETLADEGNIASGTITKTEEEYIVYNITKDIKIPLEKTSFTNPVASLGGKVYETINEIQKNAKVYNYIQYRCNTSKDFRDFLETKADIEKANAWGQQEEESDKVADINKIWFSLIPNYWGTDTISVSGSSWELATGKSDTIDIPLNYSDVYKDKVKEYLEPRELINNKKEFIVPDLIYFAFNIGVKIYDTYNFINVVNDIRNKIDYFFSISMREFGDTIDFREIAEFLRDTTKVSSTDLFSNTKGIQYITVREIFTSKGVFEPNDVKDYPQYKYSDYKNFVDNTLRPIILGNKQFPKVKSNLCTFLQEV